MRMAVGFISASSRAPTSPRVRWRQHEMDGDHVGAAEQLVLVDVLGALRLGALGREVLAPGDHLHADGGADARHPAAEVAEAQDAERAAVEVEADRGLPAAARRAWRGTPRADGGRAPASGRWRARRWRWPPPPDVPHTVTLWSLAAATSIDALRLPVVTSSLSFGSRSISARGNGVRSRMTPITSKSASARAQASTSGRCWLNTTTRWPCCSRDQSAMRKATFW